MSSTNNVRLSKELSYLLRHGAQKEGLPITSDGWIKLADICRHTRSTTSEIRQIVDTNDKQRFEIRGDRIRAVQGHSMKTLSVEMTPITHDNMPEAVIHGTYLCHLASIQKEGLKTMGRQHIHFATGRNVISGMRRDVQVLIYVDMAKCLADGIQFFRSANGVILTAGINGVLSPVYFQKVVKDL
jgi:2'-phosphotransferase